MTDTTTADKPEAPTDAPTGADRVDLLGLALQLESSSRKVESQTAQRAMLAAAHGLRMMMGAAPVQEAEPLQIAPVNNEAGSTMSIVRWQIETPAGWVGAYHKAPLEYLLAARVQEAEPAAWLVHGGKTFRDKPFMDKAQAERSVAERNDGAMVSPLHLHAARAKEGKA